MSPPIPDGWRRLRRDEATEAGDRWHWPSGAVNAAQWVGEETGWPASRMYIRKVEAHDTGEAGEVET